MSKADGVELCCRFSIEPNRLGYCGPDGAKGILPDYLRDHENRKEAKEQLKRFEGLYPYLELIAEKNDKEPFDFGVVEAYWLGSSLLENITKEDIQNLILERFSPYLTKPVAKKLSETVPDGANAHHSFHVLHILKIASIKGRVPINFDTQRKCIISWGGVMGGDLIKAVQLSFKDKYYLDEVEIEVDSHGFGKNDCLALHWEQAVAKLSDDQLNALKKYTNANITAVNSAKS